MTLHSLSLAAWTTWPTAAGLLVLCAGLVFVVHQRYKPSLASIDGPFIASFTDLWRLVAVINGRFELTLQAQHDKYGDLVRVGPNCVSVGDPREVKQIYGISRLFQKSDLYRVPQPLVNGKPVASLFMLTDEELHKAAKRPIAHAYAMTTLLDYEPFVDSTSQTFIQQLTNTYANTETVCDLGEWLQWYAFDVIGEMTFSKRLGFLEQGKDVGDLISKLRNMGAYAAIVGQMPWLDYLMGKNRFWGELMTKEVLGISKFVMQFLKPRIEEVNKARVQGDEKVPRKSNDRTDFTAKFISAFDKYQEAVPPSQLLGWSLSNINAGSDTTAITLRAIFHFLLTNPSSLSKLMAELEAANLSPLPLWRETSHLPYLGAVIKEALRLHSPVGLILERIVPEGGATICGHFFTQGTIVGCNPVIIHHDRRVYGRRYPVEEYRPERWLEADEQEKGEMERCFLAFGSGKRTCLGKNISMLEVYKLVPLLLKTFKLRLVNPKKKLHILNRFFLLQKGLDVYIESA